MDDLIEKMKEVLGTTFTLYLSTHSAHWNIEGRDFQQLHALFDEQYTEIFESIDRMAENIRALDAYCPTTLSRMIELSKVDELKAAPLFVDETLMFLMVSHEQLINLLTEANTLAINYNQQGLSNFLCERIEIHQKHRWKLRASLKS